MNKKSVKKIVFFIVILTVIIIGGGLILIQISKKVEIWPYGGECCPSGEWPKGGYSFGVYLGPRQKCCTGKTIFTDYRNRNCSVALDEMPICSDCGNNICEKWENPCNCPDDCNKYLN